MSEAKAISTNLQVNINNRDILRMALPISFAILVPQINFITNNIFLGGLSETALAVAGITGVYYLIFAVIGNGLNNGLQAIIARRAGENRVDEIGKVFSQGVRVAIGCSLFGILFTHLAAPSILKQVLKDPRHYEIAIQFLGIRIFGLPFLYLYQMRNALLVGTNQSNYLIYGTIAEAGINILLDYGLIYGHFGLPQLGFNGAAIASVVAEAAGMLVVFAVIHAKGISKQLHLYKHFGFDAATTKLILKQSSPLILQYAMSIVSWIFFFIMMEHHGELELAISNAMRNIFGLFGIFTWAFASTTNAMVSNIIGQGKKEQVIVLIRKIVRLSTGWSVFVALVLNIFPQSILFIYGQDQHFIEAAIPVVRVVSSALVLMSFATIWLNAVTGTGNTTVNLAIEVITLCFYCVYVYVVLGYYNLSAVYGWMSEWLYWILMFIMSYIYIRSGRWKKKEL